MDFPSFTESKKRQRYLLIVLILIMIAIIFFAWNYFLAKPAPIVLEPVPPPEIKINFEILESPDLEKLQLYEVISPLEEEKFGRENPFVPYYKTE